MNIFTILKGLVSRAPIGAARDGSRSLTISQLQELELEDPELQKHLMHGDESLLRYPPFLRGLPARVPGSYLLSNHAAKVRAISSGIGLPPSEFNRLIMPVLDRFASFAHMLPASQAHHHRGSGGLLAHSLEVAVHALNSCHVSVFDHDKYPAMRIKRRERWNAAAVLAALMHDVGKPLFDLQVTDASSEKIWQPVANSIPEWAEENGVDRYFFRWNPNRHDVHKHLSTTMIDRLLPQELRLWLMEGGQDLYLAMINAIACHDEKSILTGLVIKADSTSVEADLRKHGGDASGQSAMGIGVPVASLVVDTMRHLKSIGVWQINESGNRVWIIGDGIYIAWVQGVKDVTEELYEKGVKAVPRSADALGEMLLDHHILEKSPEGSIYWAVFPDLLSAGRPKPIKLKCVRLAASNLLFPFEPVPQSVAGVVGEGEYEQRFEANSNTATTAALLDGSQQLQAGDPLASFPAPGASAPASMTPMFSLGGETVDAFAPNPAAEIFSAPSLAVPDFSAPAGGADPFGNQPPKPVAPANQSMPAPESQQVKTAAVNPNTPQPNQRSKPVSATLERVSSDSIPATQITIVGAPTKAAANVPGIVVSGKQQVIVEGIKIGGREVAAPKQSDTGKAIKQGSKKTPAQNNAPNEVSKPARPAQMEEADFSMPELAVDGQMFPSGRAEGEWASMDAPESGQGLLAIDFDVPHGDSAAEPSMPTTATAPVSPAQVDADYTYDFRDVDDDVLVMAGMAIPDRTLLVEREVVDSAPARTAMAISLDEGPSLLENHDHSGESRQVNNPVGAPKPSTPKAVVRMVIPPELAGMDEFDLKDFAADISLDHLGDLPTGSPISVGLPKDMERLLYTTEPSVSEPDAYPALEEIPAHPLEMETQAHVDLGHSFDNLVSQEDLSPLDEFDLPVMSSSVMLPGLEPLGSPVHQEVALPTPEAKPQQVAEFDMTPRQAEQAKPKVAPPVKVAPTTDPVPNATHRGIDPGITISKGVDSGTPAIKVGQPRKPREPLPKSPVDILPLPEESSALAGPFHGYECSPQLAAEYEEFLALTPELTKSLRWYAANLDKTVSMVSYKPNLEFAGPGFVFDDLPRLQKAMWLWDDFTGTMNRKAPKSVMLNCYLGGVFEYLTNGKYQHSLAAAKDEVEAQNLRRIAVAALEHCKESELNGKRVVSIQPRKLSEISNALQVDEPTLKRALIATHQYLLVRNNHVIELVD